MGFIKGRYNIINPLCGALGFHSLQEFPDYPWVNIDYADVKKLFGMIKGEIDRFVGEGVFTTALVPDLLFESHIISNIARRFKRT